MPRLRRFIATLTRPVLPILLRHIPVDDPWERIDLPVTPDVFGSGSRHPVTWYFEGTSTVPVTTIADIQAWLLGCTYRSDPELFQEPDLWQHPLTFEQIRRGDCEDFALWTWRKLRELHYDADFVVGRCGPSDSSRRGRHAWVMYRSEEATYLFEPVARTWDRMIQPLTHVKDLYLPELGIGPNLKSYVYEGFVIAMRSDLACSAKDRTSRSESYP